MDIDFLSFTWSISFLTKKESAALLFHNHSSGAYDDALMEKLWIICFKLLLPIIFISPFLYS